MRRRRHPEDSGDLIESSEPGIHETLGPGMTVVARGARLEGTLVSAESIRIDGQAKGKIAARGDVFLSSHSHVEADIQAQNVVTAGTLKGSITARTMTEVEGGRVEGTIRSKALVVREGALFSGKASIDFQDAPGGVDGSSYQEDELQMGYEESVRRARRVVQVDPLWPEGGAGSQRRAGAERPGHVRAGGDHSDRGDRTRSFPRLT
jgi:cytoskeletal protein CcmA (bactofilin family)